jgi:hypothetical protein
MGMGKNKGMIDDVRGYSASQAATVGNSALTKRKVKQAAKLFMGKKPKTSLVEKVKNAYNKATGRKTVSMEMDGKTFAGTEKVGVRRSATKVSNPTSGSRKSVETYDNKGNPKRQRIVDRDASGKKIQVIKRKR